MTEVNKTNKGKVNNKPEAFIAILVSVIYVDDVISDCEVERLLFSISQLKAMKNYSENYLYKTINRLVNIIHKQGVESLLAAGIKALPHKLRETTFAVATDIILADGQVTNKESEILEHLRKKLEISELRASMLIESMLIKNMIDFEFD